MTDELELELQLRVGDTLRLEGPDGSVISYRLKQIMAYSGTDTWVSTSPHSGRIKLTLSSAETQ